VYHREVSENDIPEICKLPKTREELFYSFPRVDFPVMTAITATVFKNNQSQVVCLPKSVALDESIKQVVITAIGKTRIITPVEQSWDDWFDSEGVSDDFMKERQQELDQIGEQ